MARKPIQVEHVGMRSKRERMWEAIRALKGRPFSRHDVQRGTMPRCGLLAISSYLHVLVAGGYLRPLPAEPARKIGQDSFFELVREQWDAPRLDKHGRPVTQGLATLAMWRAMQVLKTFDYQDVARAASLGDVQVHHASAKAYVNTLARAGYFRAVQASKPGQPARYALIKNTGHQAPAITRRKCVFDRNLGAFAYQESEQEVCDGIDA